MIYKGKISLAYAPSVATLQEEYHGAPVRHCPGKTECVMLPLLFELINVNLLS